MKQQNIEMTPETSAWYSENFPSARQGAKIAVETFCESLKDHPVAGMFSDPFTAHQFMLDVWKHAWRHSLVGIKGIFTAPELMLIIDIYNGTMLSAMHYNSNSLEVGISDSIALDGMDQKWKIDGPALVEKCRGLTPMQSLCLELWANGFWYGKEASANQDRDLKEYVKPLL